ncbi:hypothetical protein BP6252_13348 [Coleophoma cylindrospora]|uniref:Cytochrome P450 alkane hydroxylase n=1 Tax=Coleophoma cylindrospora TaxID=1849047 RepID=A0A3D8QAK2_9HELO|nr:hypothetical protein BP6252_13348 [Coleophoma cylindrospora]
MVVVFNSILAGLALFILYKLTGKVSEQSKAKLRGCRPPRSRPSWDPLFGIDLFLNDSKLRSANNLMPGEASYFKELDTHTLKSATLGGTFFLTKHPENIKTTMSTKASQWGIGPIRSEAMGAFCGQGFLTTDGPVWDHSRSMLVPSFAKQNVADLSAFGGLVDQLMAKIPKDGSTFDLQPLITTMFIDSSQQFLVGQAPGVFGGQGATDAPLDSQTYLSAFNASLMGMGLRIITGSFRFLVPKSMTIVHWQKVWGYVDFYVSRSLEKKSPAAEARQRSLLESVASQTSDPHEIRNQVLQGMLAAQDTTPTLISNTIFLLARYPQVWNRLRQVLGELGPSPSADALRGVPLLRDVLRESLRLYPVFARMDRAALVDTTLPVGGGSDNSSPIFVPRGTKVMCQFYALHRNPDVFGADVETFNPDRWANINPGAWEYMPFGGGQRACLGQNKALNEASYVIWRLAREVKMLQSRDDKDYAGQLMLIVKNANGCKIACST